MLLLCGVAAASAIAPLATSLHNKFSIVLASNPTTGYSWRLGGKLDRRLVKQVGSKFIPPQTKLVGAGGREVWTFQAVGRGRARIVLEYVRPWEKNIKPVDTRVYEVIIK